jgi:hypothetical protein
MKRFNHIWDELVDQEYSGVLNQFQIQKYPLVLIYFKLMADNQISDEVYKGSWDHIKGIAKSVIDEND